MQKCKYLDELGIDIEDYGTNFVADDDSRAKEWEKERKEYGFDNRETWNLNITFIEWIYTRIMLYKEQSCVDTSYYRIPYKDKLITQEEAMDQVLSLSKEILIDTDDDELYYKNAREICDLWKELLPYMWW